MASRKSSRVNPKYKTKYRTKNWRAYEATGLGLLESDELDAHPQPGGVSFPIWKNSVAANL